MMVYLTELGQDLPRRLELHSMFCRIEEMNAEKKRMSPFEMEKMEKRPQKKRGADRPAYRALPHESELAWVDPERVAPETHTLWTSEPPWKDPEWVKPEDSASDSDRKKVETTPSNLVQGTTKEKDPKKADTDSVEGKEDSALPSQKGVAEEEPSHPSPASPEVGLEEEPSPVSPEKEISPEREKEVNFEIDPEEWRMGEGWRYDNEPEGWRMEDESLSIRSQASLLHGVVNLKKANRKIDESVLREEERRMEEEAEYARQELEMQWRREYEKQVEDETKGVVLQTEKIASLSENVAFSIDGEAMGQIEGIVSSSPSSSPSPSPKGMEKVKVIASSSPLVKQGEEEAQGGKEEEESSEKVIASSSPLVKQGEEEAQGGEEESSEKVIASSSPLVKQGGEEAQGEEEERSEEEKEWQEKWEAVWKKPWHDALQMAWSEVEEVPPREEIFLPLGKRIDIEDVSMVEDRNERARRLWIRCEECGTILYRKHVKENAKVCFTCASHIEMSSKERIESLIDADTWRPINEYISPGDPLDFEDEKLYLNRLDESQERTGLMDAIQTGTAIIEEIPVALGVMDFQFMGGSMGSVVGEKITRLIEYALDEGLFLILACASGGARMQEGIFSLMQMAKISGALNIYKSCGHLLYISLLTSPTTGGVTASFAMLGDIIIAEPKAVIGFAGRRVIEQTLQEELPSNFQTAEYLHHHGLVDLIVHRHHLREAFGESFLFHQNAPLKEENLLRVAGSTNGALTSPSLFPIPIPVPKGEREVEGDENGDGDRHGDWKNSTSNTYEAGETEETEKAPSFSFADDEAGETAETEKAPSFSFADQLEKRSDETDLLSSPQETVATIVLSEGVASPLPKRKR